MAGGLGDDPLPAGDVHEFTLQTGTLARTWPLTTPRYLHANISVGPGQHLLAGGLAPSPGGLEATAAVELLDLRKGTSERLPDLPWKTIEPIVSLLPGGRVLVAGGYDDEDVVAHTAILDISSREWHSSPPLPAPRAGSTPVRLGAHHLLVLGGWSAVGTPVSDGAMILDLVKFEGHTAALPIPRDAAVLLLDGAHLLVAGGRDPDGAPVPTVTLWTLESPLP